MSGKIVFEKLSNPHFIFEGTMGQRIKANVENWLLHAPVANPGMLEMFKVRDRKPKPEIVPWAGEFVGKYLISAIQAQKMTDNAKLGETIKGVIDELIDYQAEDGYLGPFTKEERLLGHWDLWGHYHWMLALMMWYDETGDQNALDCVIRGADLVCKTYLNTNRKVMDAGSHEMNMAIIHVLGWLYRLTNTNAYLQMMQQIEQEWEQAGDYFRTGLAGIEFYKTPKPRWESLHDIQGLVELYQITEDERYKAAFENLWWSIQRNDRHNTGGFSSGEQAIGDPYAPGAIETCCTIAWMVITVDMLRLTGSSIVADELELSTWNSMLGSQHPSGRWWTYDTPMDGIRAASAHSIVFQARPGTPELNCCSVNGPRGLGMLREWAIMSTNDGIAVNYYGPMEVSFKLQNGTNLKLKQETNYPHNGFIIIKVIPQTNSRFNMLLRIPNWSPKTIVMLNNSQIKPIETSGY
ncbi:hypothetical protein FJZ33_07730, partial [Candidatus Poribacteria bacterium]|nr:hypothetical protein [Candidatus Poribacteria bacterium]